MNRFRKSEQGFTLVELLIVVAIIGILAAIAIPQFAKYKRNAAVASCEGAVKSCISELSSQYAEDSKNTELKCPVDGLKDAITAKIDKNTGKLIDIQNATIVSGNGKSGYHIAAMFTADEGKVVCDAVTN